MRLIRLTVEASSISQKRSMGNLRGSLGPTPKMSICLPWQLLAMAATVSPNRLNSSKCHRFIDCTPPFGVRSADFAAILEPIARLKDAATHALTSRGVGCYLRSFETKKRIFCGFSIINTPIIAYFSKKVNIQLFVNPKIHLTPNLSPAFCHPELDSGSRF